MLSGTCEDGARFTVSRVPCTVNRHIIHFHIPSFPIAVARVCSPRLRGRPVVVAQAHSERGLVISVSGEAKKEGVFKGMALSTAMKLCPGMAVLAPDPALTKRASRAIEDVVRRYSPLFEPAGPGHIYIDITGTERLWGRPRDTGRRLGREIKSRLCLAGTAGVAINKMVSSIASRITPWLDVLDVDHGREYSFIAPLKVGVVPGIGGLRQKALLEELNIIRVRDLARLDVGRLRLIFGSHAPVIHQRAMGIDPTPVYPRTKQPMVVEEITLSEDENDDKRLLGVIYGLVERCSQRLRGNGLVPGKAGLFMRYSDHMERKRQIRLTNFSTIDFDLYGPLEQLFLNLCDRRVKVRFIRVWFLDFTYPSKQLSLFHTPSPLSEKNSAVIKALDRIREKHGQGAIKSGRTI
ncbi:putative DNA polymerase IV [uncultured Desulfobacterium sp.]|uniref:Putative DNA polymerase IV n=1 Tax=uncultured Desulfobacterium sp. TaxID=201089 RepID=A0A445MQT6_9BACT|nr:putative DNA polymerase IV [uncultured Desulfobacterium sp.]